MEDQQYDQLLHIHTLGSQQSFPTLVHYYPYEPTPYHVLDLCFDRIELEKDDVFVDFGCGKGRVVFYVNHRFHISTIGIEMNECYIQEAHQNKVYYSIEHHLYKAPVNFICAKAEHYKIQSTDTIFFFFNPFSIQVFRKVVNNILKSQQSNPRKMYIMLYYPSFEYIQFLRSETHFEVAKDVLVPNALAYNIHERVMIFEYKESNIMTNTWNDRFNTAEYMYGKEPNVFIKENASQLEGFKKVAAFAEGEGRNAIFLAKLGHEVTAFDYAESGLRKTKQLAEKNHVEVSTIHADLLQDDVPTEQFDAAIMVFGHFPKEQQQVVFEKILKSVKPGGKVMMELYSEKQLDYQTGGPKKLEMLYKPQDLLDWCEGTKILHFFVGEQTRQEGKLHTGLAHVIQLIIKK